MPWRTIRLAGIFGGKEMNAAIANIEAIGRAGNDNGCDASAYTIYFDNVIKLDGKTAS